MIANKHPYRYIYRPVKNKAQKTITLLLLFLLLKTGVHGQVSTFEISELVNPGQVLGSNTVFLDAALPLATSEHNFNIKNTSQLTQSISIKKSENLLHTINPGDKAEAFFCTGVTCYASHVFTGLMVLNPGESAVFKAQFIEASVAGPSDISYKFTNNTTNESSTIVLKYNNQVTSIENNSALTGLKDFKIYHDVNANAIILQCETAVGDAMLSVIDINGASIYSSKISFTDSQRTAFLINGDFNSGIYFIKIESGTNIYCRKILLHK